MKLKALIGDREEELLIKSRTDESRHEIGDRVYDLEVRESNPTVTCFSSITTCMSVALVNERASKETFDVTIRGRSHAVTIVDPKRLRSGQNSDRHHHGVAEIRAPMPGKVVRVQIEAGAALRRARA